MRILFELAEIFLICSGGVLCLSIASLIRRVSGDDIYEEENMHRNER